MNIGLDEIKFISAGVFVTLKYATLSVFFGLIFASLLTYFAFSQYKILNIFNKFYVSVFRGTPLLIQLSLIYFGIPSLTGIKISAFVSGVLAFSLNSGAYISEIIRAGINSIDSGQTEAAKTLGIPKSLIMKDIILPQAIRNLIPSLLNELIDMLKESALVSIIGEADLMRRSQLVAAEKYTYFAPLMVSAANYYILVMLLSFIIKKIERKLVK
ncbi:MAG: amino acid ABC transporter permease [Alphaproteobacteria bacterium]